MNCHHCQRMITAHAEGGLSGEAVREMEAHISGCPACRLELILARRLETALRARIPAAPPPDFTARVLAALPARPLVRASLWSESLPRLAYLVSFLALLLGIRGLGPSLARVSQAWSEKVSTLTFVLGLQSPETAGEPGWFDPLIQAVRDRTEDLVAYGSVLKEQVWWVYSANQATVYLVLAALAVAWALYDYRRLRVRA